MKSLSEIHLDVDANIVQEEVRSYTATKLSAANEGIMKKIFSFIDLTTLSERDNAENVGRMCEKVNLLVEAYPSLPNIAAICVYPELVPVVVETLENPLVNVASVGGGFPSSQTFTEIKLREIQLAVELGADEIDIVLPVGKFLQDDTALISEEIRAIKDGIGSRHLKVILETGSLKDFTLIRKASFLAMLSGADFIKTSTGKISVGATPEAVIIMAHAIKDFYNQTGKKVGIKPAGGISDPQTALTYYAIIEGILGEDWLDSERFRIGASRLANRIMAHLYQKDDNFSYF